MTSNTAPEYAPIVTLNAGALTGADFFRFIKFELNWSVISRAIERALTTQFFIEENIDAPKDEVSQYMTEYRKQRKLTTAVATKQWLQANHLSDDDFLAICEYELKLKKLKDKLFAGRVAEQFAFKKLDLETVELYRIIVESESTAKELLALIKEGADFFGMAKQHSSDETSRQQCGYLGKVHRHDLARDVEAEVFTSQEGNVIGPLRGIGGFHIYRVEKFHPAVLNETTRQLLLDEMWSEHLRHRLSAEEVKFLI